MKKTKRIGWMGCSIALVLMILPATGQAGSEDILSHFQFYVTAQEEYNSNIDLSPNRLKREDFITTLSPGIRFSTTSKSPVTGEFRQTPTAEERYGVDLDFRAGFVFYAKEHDDNYISLNGTLNGWYAFTKNLTFRVRDYLIRSDEIRELDYASTAPAGQNLVGRTIRREPYYRNVFEPSLEYRFGRENLVGVNYRNNIYRIKSQFAEDSTENYFNPRIIYWFNVRHGVSFEYGLSLGDFQRSPDLMGHMAMGRYTYRFNPRTSVFGEYTYLNRDFESPSIGYDVHQPSLGIEHAFSSTLSGRGQVGYFWQNPERGPTTSGFHYDASLSKRGDKTTYTLSLQGGYTEDFFTAENQGFTKYYRTIGSITHQLLQRMSVGLYGSYEWAKYPGTEIVGRTPVDQIWGVGGNASYQILRWLNLSLDLSHRENRSNISDRDYSEYRGMFRVTARY